MLISIKEVRTIIRDAIRRQIHESAQKMYSSVLWDRLTTLYSDNPMEFSNKVNYFESDTSLGFPKTDSIQWIILLFAIVDTETHEDVIPQDLVNLAQKSYTEIEKPSIAYTALRGSPPSHIELGRYTNCLIDCINVLRDQAITEKPTIRIPSMLDDSVYGDENTQTAVDVDVIFEICNNIMDGVRFCADSGTYGVLNFAVPENYAMPEEYADAFNNDLIEYIAFIANNRYASDKMLLYMMLVVFVANFCQEPRSEGDLLKKHITAFDKIETVIGNDQCMKIFLRHFPTLESFFISEY